MTWLAAERTRSEAAPAREGSVHRTASTCTLALVARGAFLVDQGRWRSFAVASRTVSEGAVRMDQFQDERLEFPE